MVMIDSARTQKISTATRRRGLTMDVSDDAYTALAAKLHNTNGSVPLHERFRALFTLKSLKTPRAIDIISQGTWSPYGRKRRG